MPDGAIQDERPFTKAVFFSIPRERNDRPLELFKLFGTIALDNQQANQGIDETTGKARDSQSKIVSSFKKIGAAVATYFAVDKIINFGGACIDAASNAQAMESQFTQVFGELEQEAAKNLSGIADAAGISENRMKGSYTKIAAFAKTTGMETADALSLADRALAAVADSAAFYDRSLEDTTESLQSFLKGNYENDAALGISATETTRNAAANELYGQSFKDLSEAQKQLTLLKMVEDGNALSGALGQASRESETWTNQVGNLKQSWTDFKAVIGENFLQSAISGVMKVTEVVQAASDKVPVLVNWFQNLYDRASVHFPAIQQIFQDLWTAVQFAWQTIGQPVFDMLLNCFQVVYDTFAMYWPQIQAFAVQCFTDIQTFWTTNLQPCLQAIGTFIQTVLAPVFQAVFTGTIVPLIQTAFNHIKNLWNTVLKPALTGITDFLTGVFTLNWKKAWEGVQNILKGILNGILTGIETMINGAIDAVNGLIEGLNKLVSTAGKLLGMSIHIPSIPHVNIPKLEEGGILEKGQIGLLEGRGAEAVVPLDQNKAWISAVAADMQSALGGGPQVQELNEAFRDFVQNLPEVLMDAFAAMRFDINSREFARMVKAV